MERSAIMRAVRSQNTAPERVVRSLVHELRPGYRLHRKDIPGKPDIAYKSAKIAIFVHGCFWHGHDCPRGARVPKQNRDYWITKIKRNVARDERSLATLEEMGWKTLVVWECELRQGEMLRERLAAFLN